MKTFKYCPTCKETLQHSGNSVKCSKCNFIHYFDPTPTVAVIPIKDGKILMAIRKVEPFKGGLDLIGGFINKGETAEEAAIREAKEETGLDIKITGYYKSYPDFYGSKDKPVLGFDFLAEVIGGTLKAGDDVAKLKWIPIKDLPNINTNSFDNVKKVLTDLYNLSRGAEN